MRDPKRIDTVTEKLKEAWKLVPDMRFFQFIQALDFPKEKEGTDPFFWEDDVWEKVFDAAAKKYGRKKEQ